MKRQVPRKRATRSERRPKASESYVGRWMPRRTSRGWSMRGRRRSSRATDSLTGRPLAPVRREQVVEHVVDGDRTEEVVGIVDDGDRDKVVGRQVRRHL